MCFCIVSVFFSLIFIAQCSVGLEFGKVEAQQEDDDTTASSSSSELQEIEAELQAILSALEQQEPTHTPDEDKVHTHDVMQHFATRITIP